MFRRSLMIVTVSALCANAALAQEWIYWAEVDRIQRARIDGTEVEDVIAGLQYPSDPVVDPVHGKIYWQESMPNGTGAIRRADLDGSNVEDILAVDGNPAGLALDLADERLYWVHWFGCCSSTVGRAHLDGSNVQHMYALGELHLESTCLFLP